MAGRHLRTLAGLGFMLFSLGFVLLTRFVRPDATPCAATVTEVVHEWLFPVLLFAGGLALFNRHAFNDVWTAGRSFTRRRRDSQ